MQVLTPIPFVRTVSVLLVQCRPIYPRAIILLIPLAFIPDREVLFAANTDISFARVSTIDYFVACSPWLGVPLLFGLTILIAHTTAGELVLASYRHTRPAARALEQAPEAQHLTLDAERGQQNVGRWLGRESSAIYRSRQ